MRAICGAIIAAGGMIGLGLLSIGAGIRYQRYEQTVDGHIRGLGFGSLDFALQISLILLIIGMAVGLGIAFFGLAYHHYRRHQEWQHHLGLHRTETTTRTP